jgi:hypothetical protein
MLTWETTVEAQALSVIQYGPPRGLRGCGAETLATSNGRMCSARCYESGPALQTTPQGRSRQESLKMDCG